MAGKEIIMLTQKELRRLHVIHKVLDRRLKQVDAGKILSLSDRQIRRVVKEVRGQGDEGIRHKSRGRASNRRLSGEIKGMVIKLYREKYNDFGPTLLEEKLLEEEGITISDETLRIWLIESGYWKKKRKGKAHRRWRERKSHFGEMVQMDGSHHDWFEGRVSKCVLMGYIDDATGEAFGRFHEYEGTIPAMESFRRYIERYKIPMSIYLDKHTTYKSTGKPTIEEELNGTGPLSEFERAMKELGVEVIHAGSPQAKGRIERLFKTFQDRLIKEMRLRGISTIEDGNRFLLEYLPEYNRRFVVRPEKGGDLHREIPDGIDLDRILCIKTERVLRNDFTVAHNRKLYQVEDRVITRKVIVEERLDGGIAITHKGRCLRFKEITTRPEREKQSKPVRLMKRYTPPSDHPWRRFTFGKQSNG